MYHRRLSAAILLDTIGNEEARHDHLIDEWYDKKSLKKTFEIHKKSTFILYSFCSIL